MLGRVAASLSQSDDTSPTLVGIPVYRRDGAAIAIDVVEHQPFAQREVAEHELFGAKPLEDRVEHDRARDDEIRPAWIEAGQMQALVEIELDEALAQPVNESSRNTPVAQRIGAASPSVRQGEGPEAEDRAGCPDDLIETAAGDRFDTISDLPCDVLHHAPLVTLHEGIGSHESPGQADHADLEAARELHSRGRAARNLHAATADVDHDRSARADVDAIGRREMNEVGLFGPGNHLRADSKIPMGGSQKIRAVLGLTDGARRGGDDLIDLMGPRKLGELRQGAARSAERAVGQGTTVEAAGAQPHHVLLAIDDLEREIGTHLGHDHVNGIGPDIDCREAHRFLGRNGLTKMAASDSFSAN